MRSLRASDACLTSIARLEVKGPDGRVKRVLQKSRPLIFIYKNITITGPDGKVKSTTGDQITHSYVLQFLQILEAKMRCGVGSVTGKDTGNNSVTIQNSTYNGISDMMRCDAQNADETYGIVVGTGTGAEDNADYKLGTKIANGVGSGQLLYGPVSFVAPAVNGSGVDQVIIRALYNGSGNAITAYEFGIYVKVGIPTAKIFCIIRDLEAGGKTVAAGDTMTVQYTLKTGAGFTIRFLNYLYSMFKNLSAGDYDTSHTYRIMIYDNDGLHGAGRYSDNGNLFFAAGPYDSWYFYSQNSQDFGILVGNAGAATGVITGVTNPGGGKITVVCSAAHGLGPGQSVTIAGTTNYNGTYTIITGSGTSFTVTATYVSSQAGTWSLPGDDAESPNDYKLQHKLTALTYLGTTWIATLITGGNVDLAFSRGFYNGTGASIDVEEIGLAIESLYDTGYSDHGFYLLLRDLLAGIVAVDPSDTLTVQYTLRTNVAT